MRDAEKTAAVVAIIPAAGRSGRMGTPKQLLHIDGKPMLLGIVDALLGGGAESVTVVTNSGVREQLPSLPQNVDVVLNDDPKTQMIESIRMGLVSSPSVDGYLVCPSDAARITAADVRRCVKAFAETPGHIVIATHDGTRGHPMIFPQAMAPVVQSAECDAGLHQLSRNRPRLVREVVCDSPGTVSNVNTPADYEKLK